MISDTKISEAADRIWNSISAGTTCAPVRDILGTTDIESAYKAQKINTQRKLGNGENIVGYKIGLTSLAVQKQLGVDQPDFGVLTDAMQVNELTSIASKDLFQPKVEAEVGFIVQEDIGTAPESVNELVPSLSGAVCCIEVVGSRIENWNIQITDTIADNASASHFVVSKEIVPIKDLNLEQCTMSMTRNGETVSEGIGSACMGNPLNAALWLVQTMQKFGQPVKKGDIILAGALGPMVAVKPMDKFEAEIEGLGMVSVSFGA